MSDNKDIQAKTLLEEGKIAYDNGIYDTSVSKLGEACQLFDEINGDLAPENGDAYFIYGQALLQYAIQQNTVLGQSAQASATAVEEQQEIAKEVEAESSNPLFQLGGMPEFKADTTEQEDDNEYEDEEKEEEEGEEGPAEDDFETAWDILDVARVIFEKSEDEKTQLKLADVHLCLGDVSLETEKFNEALSDYEKAIDIKKLLLQDDNRELAEAHYKYALALEFSSDKTDQALPQLEKAVAVLKKRIKTLEMSTTEEGKSKGKATETALSKKAQNEIAEIQEIIPDMELKIEELSNRQATEKEAEALLRAMLGADQGDISKVKLAEATTINDLSTLVKRKSKEVVSTTAEEDPKEKKQKLE